MAAGCVLGQGKAIATGAVDHELVQQRLEGVGEALDRLERGLDRVDNGLDRVDAQPAAMLLRPLYAERNGDGRPCGREPD